MYFTCNDDEPGCFSTGGQLLFQTAKTGGAMSVEGGLVRRCRSGRHPRQGMPGVCPWTALRHQFVKKFLCLKKICFPREESLFKNFSAKKHSITKNVEE